MRTLLKMCKCTPSWHARLKLTTVCFLGMYIHETYSKSKSFCQKTIMFDRDLNMLSPAET